MKKTVDELFADGLVAKLELQPGRYYILMFDRRFISSDQVLTLNQYIYEKWGIRGVSLCTAGGKDVLHAVEIE